MMNSQYLLFLKIFKKWPLFENLKIFVITYLSIVKKNSSVDQIKFYWELHDTISEVPFYTELREI